MFREMVLSFVLTVLMVAIMQQEIVTASATEGTEVQVDQTDDCALDGNSCYCSGVSAANLRLIRLIGAINSLEQRLLTKIDEMASSSSATDGTAPGVPLKCRSPFIFIAGGCFFLERSHNRTWSQAREFCQEIGSDLAVFKDVSAFGAMLQYLKSSNVDAFSWIGGTDQQKEDHWLWVDGNAMPRGSPYWGIKNHFRMEPTGKAMQNCAILYNLDHYLMHDFRCDDPDGNSLCQYFPSG